MRKYNTKSTIKQELADGHTPDTNQVSGEGQPPPHNLKVSKKGKKPYRYFVSNFAEEAEIICYSYSSTRVIG